MGILHDDQYTFMIISCLILLKMTNVSDKRCTENQNTHILCSITLSEDRAVYEVPWKNTAEPDRPQMTMWYIRIGCWIPKATNTH